MSTGATGPAYPPMKRARLRASTAPGVAGIRVSLRTLAMSGSGIALLLAAGVAGSGRVALSLGALGAILLCRVLMRIAEGMARGLVIARLAIGAFVLQGVWLFVIAAFGFDTVIVASSYHPDLANAVLITSLSLLAVPLGILGAIALARLAGAQTRAASPWAAILQHPDHELKKFLVLGALVLLAYWPAATVNSGFLGYAVRVLARGLLLLPFLAGRYAKQFRGVQPLWYAAMAVNASIGMVLGSRFVALLPIALFVAGHVSTLAGRRRLRVIALATLVAIPGFAVSGAISEVRGQLGRGGIELLSSERVVHVVDGVAETLQSGGGDWFTSANAGISRMLIQPNLAVPILTSSSVPMRGTAGLPEEIKGAAEISALTGRTRENYLVAGLGTAPAVRYGFLVNTETSVEFGVVADGWSRGGPAVAVLYGAIFGFVLVLIERVLRRLTRLRPAATVVLLTSLAYTAFLEIGSLPLASVVRSALLTTGFLGLVVLVMNLVGRSRRSARG